MGKLNLLKTLVAAIGLTATATQASLLTNSSFEEDASGYTELFADSTGNNSWAVYDGLNGWTAGAAGVELQQSGLQGNMNAFDGNTYVELDTHFDYDAPTDSNSSIYQTLSGLTVGAEYELSFAYASRTDLADDNGIEVFWSDAVATLFDNSILSIDYTVDNLLNWTMITTTLVASSEDMTLGFKAFGDTSWTFDGKTNPDSNGKGGFLDAVSVTAVDVPEPASLGIIALGLLGMGALRRRA
ncbi:PEP-CTERM sorting domain-containing protein [Lacimicrobium alkaliphilum]|uniref:Ice-binding protein C-terminal domain-containing protein n=1 Tax=Lacimicrobium alkaliphilum TaxID=1526571 RepID=A0ABQ1RSJ3_9ALTE|nr:PEP-CTERM sorting domain-containing protein [Lacimicrobium alkaliphilum]GGD76719.1 hypothetical protein GCM10011357_34700 [Lacimicrobium alkaliphilum]